MRFRKKHNSCLNCGYPLDRIYNYCPHCGQENTDSHINFKLLVGDFLSNYLALDSRFGRTIKPFFFNPGYLTTEFMDGKRNSYAHPIRIYLVISLIFFAILSITASYLVSKDDNEIVNETSGVELRHIEGIPDSTRKKISFAMDNSDIEEINEMDSMAIDQLKYELYKLSYSDKTDVVAVLSPEEIALLDYIETDTLKKDLPSLSEIDAVPLEHDPDHKSNEETRFMADNYFVRIDSLSKIDDLSVSQVVDSLKLPNATNFQLYTSKQMVRVIRAGKEIAVSYIIKNLPIMMLLLIPIFALILKLLYIRRGQYYITHLIHALHIHSFAYLIYAICFVITVYFLNDLADNIILTISILIVTVYSYYSFIRVYKQKRFKTFIKFIIVGTTYVMIISFVFSLEVFISFLIF